MCGVFQTKSTYDNDFLINEAWPFIKEVEYFWNDERNLKYDPVKGWEVLNSSAREDENNNSVGNAPYRNAATDVGYLMQFYKACGMRRGQDGKWEIKPFPVR